VTGQEDKLGTTRRLIELINSQPLVPGTGPHPEVVPMFTEDAEIVPFRAALEGETFSAKRAFEAFAESWSHLEVEILELRAVGPHVFLGGNIDLVGRESGAELTRPLSVAVHFAGRLIRRYEPHPSREAALRALRRDAVAAARLYFVCEGMPDGGPPDKLLAAALSGGADLIQLREKAPRCAEEIVALAEPFRRAAAEHEALFIVNDHPDLVADCGADGVHVGQDDAPVAEARAAAGRDALIGLSTHSPEQVDAAVAAEGPARPDQISVGPVWETPTKEGRPATGLRLIEHAAAVAGELPWFAIGGIDAANVGEIVAAGARRAVVVRTIRDAADPEAAARTLREALDG
jgi:thiamine-phosphate pyrophosphorylase